MPTSKAIKLEKGQLIMSFCLQDKLNCSIFGHGGTRTTEPEPRYPSSKFKSGTRDSLQSLKVGPS